MEHTIPLYLNWSFWAVVVAALAVALSQFPPVVMWFRRARLEIDAYSRIAITHKIGNPNATAHLILVNDGGRSIRVRKVLLIFDRNGTHAFTLPAQNFFEQSDSKGTLLFTPFSLKATEEWSHSCNFLNYLNRDDEKKYRALEAGLRIDILAKRAAEPDKLVEADPKYVEPIQQFFEAKFGWLPGEYELKVQVDTDRGTYEKRFRFTIFESESDVLRALTTDYKYGAGVYWDRADIPTSVALELHEVAA